MGNLLGAISTCQSQSSSCLNVCCGRCWWYICKFTHPELNKNHKICCTSAYYGEQKSEVNVKESVGRKEYSLVDHLQGELLDLK